MGSSCGLTQFFMQTAQVNDWFMENIVERAMDYTTTHMQWDLVVIFIRMVE